MDMASLNAWGMIILVGVSLLALASLPKRARSEWQWKMPLAVCLAYMLVESAMSAHLCNAGNPSLQWLVPGLFLFAVLSVVRSPWHWAAALVIALAGVLLTEHATHAVHSGFPINNDLRRAHIPILTYAAHAIRTSGVVSLSPGPVAPEILAKSDLKDRLDSSGHVLAPHFRPHWFTPVTGMYERYDAPMTIVFDGGPADQCSASQLHMVEPLVPSSSH